MGSARQGNNFASRLLRAGKFQISAVAALIAGGATLGVSSRSNASIILSWSSTSGYAGTETSLPVATYGTGIVATDDAITRANGLSGNAGAGSFNSAGWTSGYLTFSLTTTAGGSYSLVDFQVEDRASGTGPGTLGLYYSGNNYSAPLGTWTDAASTGTREENVALTSATLSPNTTYTFRIAAANQTSNAGGSIGASGTYRIISPTIELDGNALPVPEPTATALLAACTGGLFYRNRRK